MLKTVSGKRDLGQCEVSRLLMSEPLYSCTFEFVVLCLDLKLSRDIIPVNEATDESALITNETLMDQFAKRHSNPKLQPILSEINNIYSFVKKFKMFKGKYKNIFIFILKVFIF